MYDIIDDIALTLEPGVGAKTAAHLVSRMGSARGVFAASADELMQRAELNSAIAREIVKKKSHRQAEAEVKYCLKHEIMPIPVASSQYPELLRECNDYPHVIYYKGDPAALGGRMISIVGTRSMTSYGQKVCNKIVGELAEMFPDVIVVSGLAFGIDGEAHRAALAAKVRTVGVLANSLPEVTPAQHALLGAEMVKRGGGLLTEYHSQYRNNGNLFVPRNRIIAGMSLGTIVVESSFTGGALVTTELAGGYGRSVMAVPGRVGDIASAGTNHQIKIQKAVMVCSGRDIANELGWKIPEKSTSRPKAYDESVLDEPSRRLLAMIGDGEQVDIDQLAHISAMPVNDIVSILFKLELEGAVRLLPGNIYERA